MQELLKKLSKGLEEYCLELCEGECCKFDEDFKWEMPYWEFDELIKRKIEQGIIYRALRAIGKDWKTLFTELEAMRMKAKGQLKELENGVQGYKLLGYCPNYNKKTHKCEIQEQKPKDCKQFPLDIRPDGKKTRGYEFGIHIKCPYIRIHAEEIATKILAYGQELVIIVNGAPKRVYTWQETKRIIERYEEM